MTRSVAPLVAAPLRSSLLALAVALACMAGALMLARLAAPAAALGPPSTLRVTAAEGSRGGAGLRLEQLRQLQATLAGRLVGGAVRLDPQELAPQLAPVDQLSVLAADPQWVALMGIEPRSGRPLLAEDEARAASVCLLSAGMAQALAPDASALGRSLRLDSSWLTVVGTFAGSGRSDAPDLILPLSSGLARLMPAEGTLDEVLVEDTGDSDGLGALVLRVLDRGQEGPRGWSLRGAGRQGPRGELRGELTLLGLVLGLGLLAGGLAFEGLTLPWGRPLRAGWGAICCTLLAVPGLALAQAMAGVLGCCAAPALPSLPWCALALLPGAALGALLGAISPGRAPAS